MKWLVVVLVVSVWMVEARSPKWFLPQRTVTSILMQRNMVTHSVPSSCIALEPSIPPCRNVRQLQVNPSHPTRLESTPLPEMMGPRSFDQTPPLPRVTHFSEIESSLGNGLEESRGWSSFLGMGDVTVTKTMIKDSTVKKVDPNTVVTFSVKGCQPTRLPFDLPLCPENQETTPKQQISREWHYAQEEP